MHLSFAFGVFIAINQNAQDSRKIYEQEKKVIQYH